MKKGLAPWVREHRTSLPSQGRSLVSPIWPCVAHYCWILSSRGKNKHLLTSSWRMRRKETLKHRLQHCSSAQGNPHMKGMFTQWPRSPDDSRSWRHAGLRLKMLAVAKSCTRQCRRSPPRTHQMEDSQQDSSDFAAVKAQTQTKRSWRSGRSPKSFQSTPENIVYWLVFAKGYCKKRPSLPHWIPSYLETIPQELWRSHSHL